MMKPRLAALLVSIALLMVPVPAVGWSNGEQGCNSFGTHDWILKKAINAAGRDARWVRVRVALTATDDPDCKHGIDYASGTWWHVYDRWRATYGDADKAARVWFRRTDRRLAEGRKRSASKALGVLAHIVGDVAQPMHTDSSDREDDVHGAYEDAVDLRIRNYRFSHDGRDAARPGQTTRTVARRAHLYYSELVRAYGRHGYNAKVHRITKRQLRDGANALADLIKTLS